MQKFNYHSHTYRCGHADLEMKEEDYIEEYIKMGFQKMAFTDHCPEKHEIDKRPNIRMRYDQKGEYISSIKALKDKYADKIEIEVGYEIEYLPGEEDNLKELREESDKIILGQHFIYDINGQLKILGKNHYTDEELLIYARYIEEAMKLNLPDIVAHPDMYMLNRKFGTIEEKIANSICAAAQKYHIPLEINLNNIFSNTYFINKKLNQDSFEKQKERLKNVCYPCKEFWNIATQYDIKVLYGIDTHYKGQILLWNELRELANEVIGKETIEKLNFLELSDSKPML